ncbi:HU family DNA-binding protein [Paracoccus sp. p4-l81]
MTADHSSAGTKAAPRGAAKAKTDGKTRDTKTAGKAAQKSAGPRSAAPRTAAKPVVTTGVVRKKEFTERILAQVSGNKSAAKDTINATLAALASAIQQGEALAIAGFGKTRVNRHVTRSGADTYVVRFKPAMAKDGAKGLEDDDDDV